jgi:ubiquinone/menaquinone biosynthesis C-methylase UbiE
MTTRNVPEPEPHARRTSGIVELLTGLSMTVGRGNRARAVADVANITAEDRVLDIGCGPGAAARRGARQGAAVTGVDPSPVMLRLVRWISAARRAHGLEWRVGRAEALPAKNGSVTVVWAISTFHHWDDPAAGLGEIRRVLAPGGRVVLAERLVPPGAHGHAAHGLTADQAADLAAELTAAGFTDIHRDTRRAGRQTLVVVAGVSPE